MPSLPRVPALLGTVVALLVASAVPAVAQTPTFVDEEPLFGGLTHEKFEVRLSDGEVARGNLLRFDEDDPHLRLRPELAQRQVTGLESPIAMARRLRSENAIAGTNGGYWINRHSGNPNGLHVQDRRLTGANASTWRGSHRARSALGIGASGGLLLNQVQTELTVTLPDGTTQPVPYMNRQAMRQRYVDDDTVGDVVFEDVIVYDDQFGARLDVPADSMLLVLDGLDLRAGGTATATVTGRRHDDTDSRYPNEDRPLPEGAAALIAHKEAEGIEQFREVSTGQQLQFDTRVVTTQGGEVWPSDLEGALPAGGTLLRDGQIPTETEWRAEAFSASHVSNRQPRTAIGRTPDGEALLVTIDGRNNGWSVGMTMREVAGMLRELGARDAVNLDGGGSTTMAVAGEVANRPSETGRSVASGLFVHYDYPFDHTVRRAGADRYATAAEIARASHPEGAEEVVIATGAAFPDALAGGALAGHRDAPLLLTGPGSLPTATREAIGRLSPDRATVLGGPNAVSEDVTAELRGLGLQVDRLEGATRNGTAEAIARALQPTGDIERAFVVANHDFPDALSASGPAGRLGAPILLGGRDALPAETRTFLEERAVEEVVIVGGTSAVGTEVERELRDELGLTIQRLDGADRYATAGAVNDWAATEVGGHDPAGMVVANAADFPDALAGGPLAASSAHPLMIVPPRDVRRSDAASAYLDASAPELQQVTLLGGEAALTLYQRWQLDQLAAN